MKNTMCCLLLSLLAFPLMAQENEAKTDSLQINPQADPPRTFSLVFDRGFLLTGSAQPDSVPISGNSSGTFFIGGGFRVPFGKNVVGLRITPGFAWTTHNYNQTSAKSFPTVPDSLAQSLTSESIRIGSVQLPVGVYINFSRDEDNDPKFFMELGGYAGYVTGVNYRNRFEDGVRRVQTRIRGLEKEADEYRRLRYGLYGRLGYKWAALMIKVRLSDVYDEFANTPPNGITGYKNPKIPPIQFGFTIQLGSG
ncbi:MAG: outer membrane beta-barrel protein [Bacteroidota bacterium]